MPTPGGRTYRRGALLHWLRFADGPACRTSAPIPTSSSRRSRRRSGGAPRAPAHLFRRVGRGRQDLRDARRGASAARRRQGCRSSASSRPTAARRPRRCCRVSRCCRWPTIEYQGRTLREFDLDAALKRRPALILVDELAHTNAQGSRHPKRWQDIEELLASGIDVFTTLNVQHLESLNDVVGGITGITVWETVPDTFFDEADEVMLVDIPADDLLARLKAGKVYVPEQIERAARNFFRKGNLMALRELALRRTADRVEDDVQAYRSDKAIEPRLEDRGIAPVLRRARCPARRCRPQRRAARDPARRRMDRGLRRDAGAAAAAGRRTRAHPAHGEARPGAGRDDRDPRRARHPARCVVDYARTHNCSKVSSAAARRQRAAVAAAPCSATRRDARARHRPDRDRPRRGDDAPKGRRPSADAAGGGRSAAAAPSAFATCGPSAACAFTTLVATALLPYFDLANIVMLFLLTVVLVAVRFGRGPAVLAAFVSVGRVRFLLRAAAVLVRGERRAVPADLRRDARGRAHHRADDGGTALPGDASRRIARSARARSTSSRATCRACCRPSRWSTPPPASSRGRSARRSRCSSRTSRSASPCATRAAQRSPSTSAPRSGRSTRRSRRASAPIRSPAARSCTCRCARRCARAACSRSGRRIAGCCSCPSSKRQLDTFAALAAIALERVHYVEVAQQALLQMESERLRNSLLVGALARPAHAARRAGRAGRIARDDEAAAVAGRSSRPRRRSPTRRAG